MADSGRPPRRRWTPLPSTNRAPTSLRDALDTLASTMGLSNVDSTQALLVDWPDIVGAQLADKCKPQSLRDQVLTVKAHDHQWATELRWMTNLIIERCCEALGADAVTEVRIIR